ncbi:MAG: hypothetical protein QM626_05565 [Microbacterium sp.]|uniref:hypothetical protein n=1 Tax=Microbacterium sp. TaxID=51671 RepID=UPI0039E390E3
MSTVSSTPILRTALIWSGIVTGVLAVIGVVVGFLVGGGAGLVSALAGVLAAAVFLSITAASILVANRWFGDPLYVPIFFGVVLGGWLVKIVVFVVAMLVLRDQSWIDRPVFFVALVAGVVAALVVDVVVMTRMRLPAVSDTTLPTDPDEGDRTDSAP